MTDIILEVQKAINLEQLDSELKVAGFKHFGSSLNGDRLTVHLEDTETKNPAIMVEAHVAVILPPLDFLVDLKAATTLNALKVALVKILGENKGYLPA